MSGNGAIHVLSQIHQNWGLDIDGIGIGKLELLSVRRVVMASKLVPMSNFSIVINNRRDIAIFYIITIFFSSKS